MRGTCPSKAHGLIDRMSEDIDFKLVVPEDLSHNVRSRRLSRYKKRLAQDMALLGFYVPADQIKARDENSYVSLNLHYESRFPPVTSLRTEIKVELNARPPVLPTASLPIWSLLSGLTGESAVGVSIECIAIEGTLAEKVLSFLRRTAEAQAGRNRGDYDERLVRHLYDVHAIVCSSECLQLPHQHLAAMVAVDAAQYRNQYPEFEQDPVGQMRAAMESLHSDTGNFEQNYLKFVDELVFGESVPYAETRSMFIIWLNNWFQPCRFRQDQRQRCHKWLAMLHDSDQSDGSDELEAKSDSDHLQPKKLLLWRLQPRLTGPQVRMAAKVVQAALGRSREFRFDYASKAPA